MKKHILMAILATVALVGCERADRSTRMNEPAGAENTSTNQSSRSSGQDTTGSSGQNQTGGAVGTNQSGGGGTSRGNP